MSIALFALADASISEVTKDSGSKKTPPKRVVTAVREAAAVPEPR